MHYVLCYFSKKALIIFIYIQLHSIIIYFAQFCLIAFNFIRLRLIFVIIFVFWSNFRSSTMLPHCSHPQMVDPAHDAVPSSRVGLHICWLHVCPLIANNTIRIDHIWRLNQFVATRCWLKPHHGLNNYLPIMLFQYPFMHFRSKNDRL